MKAVRVMIYDGPEDWVKHVIAISLPEGATQFGNNAKVYVSTNYIDDAGRMAPAPGTTEKP